MRRNFVLHYETTIAAAHRLTKDVYTKACARQHGHQYRIVFTILATKLDETDMVIDFGKLKDLAKRYDHRDLNDFFENPTSEVLAKHLAEEVFKMLPDAEYVGVTVWESDHSHVRHEIRNDDLTRLLDTCKQLDKSLREKETSQ